MSDQPSIDVDKIIAGMCAAYLVTPPHIIEAAPADLKTVEAPKFVALIKTLNPLLMPALHHLRLRFPQFTYQLASPHKPCDTEQEQGLLAIPISIPVYPHLKTDAKRLSIFINLKDIDPPWINAGDIYIPSTGLHITERCAPKHPATRTGTEGAICTLTREMLERGWQPQPVSVKPSPLSTSRPQAKATYPMPLQSLGEHLSSPPYRRRF